VSFPRCFWSAHIYVLLSVRRLESVNRITNGQEASEGDPGISGLGGAEISFGRLTCGWAYIGIYPRNTGIGLAQHRRVGRATAAHCGVICAKIPALFLVSVPVVR
jgi:hypothetical protein